MSPAQPPCTFSEPAAVFTIHRVEGEPPLTLDAKADVWRTASETVLDKDCHKSVTYRELRTRIRSFWTRDSVYFLFRCPYQHLNLFLPADNTHPRDKLWDRDVVELFIGADAKNINHYREFEVAPTGDWIDLAIDLDRNSFDQTWRSGWQTLARIDEKQKIWYAAVKIPLRSITAEAPAPGTEWRMDLYRIDGASPDANRRFMCWQPICTPEHPSNHTPSHFGALAFAR